MGPRLLETQPDNWQLLLLAGLIALNPATRRPPAPICKGHPTLSLYPPPHTPATDWPWAA